MSRASFRMGPALRSVGGRQISRTRPIDPPGVRGAPDTGTEAISVSKFRNVLSAVGPPGRQAWCVDNAYLGGPTKQGLSRGLRLRVSSD
jgi:hypothetical protein